MKVSSSKAERSLQIESTVSDHPGIHRSELTGRLGVHKSTISRDTDDLSILYPLIDDENGGLLFPEGYSLGSGVPHRRSDCRSCGQSAEFLTSHPLRVRGLKQTMRGKIAHGSRQTASEYNKLLYI